MNKLTAATAALLSTFGLAPAWGDPPATFPQVQSMAIHTTGYSQVLWHDYTDGSSATGIVAAGDRTQTYAIRIDNFVGLFLYDYSYAAFTFSAHVYGHR